MTILSKDAILGANDIKAEDVTVPEWGGSIRIAVMSGRARDQFLALNSTKEEGYSLFQARLLAATVVDESGNLLFTADDIETLRGKSRIVLDQLTDVATRINGMNAEAVGDATKNSEAAPSGDSGSNLASTSESQ